jgi:hypothetical protein
LLGKRFGGAEERFLRERLIRLSSPLSLGIEGTKIQV